MADAAASVLSADDLRDSDGLAYSPDVTDRVREILRTRAERTLPNVEGEERTRDKYLELLLIVLGAERTTMLQARSEGRYSSRVINRAQRSLDLQETLLQRLPGTASPSA
jgi:hypothetical protein